VAAARAKHLCSGGAGEAEDLDQHLREVLHKPLAPLGVADVDVHRAERRERADRARDAAHVRLPRAAAGFRPRRRDEVGERVGLEHESHPLLREAADDLGERLDELTGVPLEAGLAARQLAHARRRGAVAVGQVVHDEDGEHWAARRPLPSPRLRQRVASELEVANAVDPDGRGYVRRGVERRTERRRRPAHAGNGRRHLRRVHRVDKELDVGERVGTERARQGRQHVDGRT